MGLVSHQRQAAFDEKMQVLDENQKAFPKTLVFPNSDLAAALALNLRRETTLEECLKRPEVNAPMMAKALGMDIDQGVAFRALEQFEIETKYAGYIKRQNDEIEKIRRHEGLQIPPQMDFLNIEGLSNELRQKLDHHRPESLARAARIPGMTPAALSVLLVHAKALQNKALQNKALER
jgi:tRNA uridine 5-carboxymethylaminomethyl modification enzyme